MKNLTWALLIPLLLLACRQTSSSPSAAINEAQEKKNIAAVLDSFNVAAANADYNLYFSFFADSNSTFIGTDALEVWNRNEFMKWSKPFFDRKSAWNFKSIKRNIYLSQSGNEAWFDELLETPMKICRGSGVLTLKNGTWKINQYVLSVTMPNEKIDEAVRLKSTIEDSLMNTLR